MPREDLSVDQLLALLNDKVRSLSTVGTKYDPTVSKSPSGYDLRSDPILRQLARVDTELRSTINAIQPVNRLPTEILAEIFAYIHPRLLQRYLPLIHATHVCRHWRNVIWSTPRSWTWINPKWAALLPLSLRLSGSASIEVEVPSVDSFSFGFVELLLPHCARVASFTLAFSAATRGYCSKIIGRLQCMPDLRELSILAEPGLTTYWLPILSGGMPHLESITLSVFSYGQQVVQLTHLSTINITVEYSTLAEVVELFANNPKLRSATLCGSFRNKSCQRKPGGIRMVSLRQLDLLSWSATSLLQFLALEKGAHICMFGPAFILETIGSEGFFPSDTTFLPNLASLKQLRWYIMSRDTLMEFSGPNGSFSILLPRPEVQTFATDSFPLGEIEELHCESSISSDLLTGTKELNRIIRGMAPAMTQLRKVTFAMCTNSIIQIVLSNLNWATHLKGVTLSHCDHPDPTHDVFHTLLLFARGRILIGPKLEEIRIVCRTNAQRTGFLDHRLAKLVKSFTIVHQSPSETGRTNIEIHRGFPASIRKTTLSVLNSSRF